MSPGDLFSGLLCSAGFEMYGLVCLETLEGSSLTVQSLPAF